LVCFWFKPWFRTGQLWTFTPGIAKYWVMWRWFRDSIQNLKYQAALQVSWSQKLN
jgi:hypothetical protein